VSDSPIIIGADLGNATVPALLRDRCASHGDEVAFAYKRQGKWVRRSWNEYAALVCKLSAALARDGLAKGDRVGIIGDVSPEWMLADMATLCSGGVTVGIYFTSSAEEVDYYLNDSGASFVFVGGRRELDIVLRTRPAAALLKIVVLDPDWAQDGSADNVVSLSQFIAESTGAFSRLHQAASETRSSDIASIGYTSGTTGNPKGAVLTHLSLLAGANTVATFCPAMYSEPQRVVVHLPFSHTVARAQGTSLPLITRVVPYFGENTALFAETIRDVKPTYYMAPPRFYQRFAAQLISLVQSGSPQTKRAYSLAMTLAKKALRDRQSGKKPDDFLAALNEVCRNKVFLPLLAEIGFDQLKHPYTASAPMPSEVMTLWQVWGLNLKECYGQTEMVGGNVGQMVDWSKAGTIGFPIPDPSWQTKILDDGEMIVKGPGLFTGYWNKPEETKSALRDGWLYTGDIIEVQKNGAFKLVDRKKEIINTAGGKSISPTQIENELRQSPFISEAAVLGEGKKYLTALIEVNATTMMDWAKARDCGIREYADLSRSDVVIRLIEGEVAKANGRVARAEQIKAFRILPEELSPENGVMTPTRKKRRKPIAERYRGLIESLYDDSEEQLIRNELGGLKLGAPQQKQ
jgi:long-chain acyl-CoA synthetase